MYINTSLAGLRAYPLCCSAGNGAVEDNEGRSEKSDQLPNLKTGMLREYQHIQRKRRFSTEAGYLIVRQMKYALLWMRYKSIIRYSQEVSFSVRKKGYFCSV